MRFVGSEEETGSSQRRGATSSKELSKQGRKEDSYGERSQRALNAANYTLKNHTQTAVDTHLIPMRNIPLWRFIEKACKRHFVS